MSSLREMCFANSRAEEGWLRPLAVRPGQVALEPPFPQLWRHTCLHPRACPRKCPWWLSYLCS